MAPHIIVLVTMTTVIRQKTAALGASDKVLPQTARNTKQYPCWNSKTQMTTFTSAPAPTTFTSAPIPDTITSTSAPAPVPQHSHQLQLSCFQMASLETQILFPQDLADVAGIKIIPRCSKQVSFHPFDGAVPLHVYMGMPFHEGPANPTIAFSGLWGLVFFFARDSSRNQLCRAAVERNADRTSSTKVVTKGESGRGKMLKRMSELFSSTG